VKHQFASYYLDSPLQTERIYDVFMPENVTREIAVFIIHGGGWRAGSRSRHFHGLMEELNNRGYIAASTDYRLNVTPAEQLADVRESYLHFTRVLKESGRPVKIAVYGSSAGAHLGSLLTCARPGECGDDFPAEGWIEPVCGVFQSCPASFEPWEDIFPGSWDSMRSVVGVPYEKDPEPYRKLSLNRHVRPGNPPIFFLAAEMEHMFPNGQIIELAGKMNAMGNRALVKIYPRVEHGFLYSLERWQQREAFEDCLRFVDGKEIAGCTVP